MSFRVLDALPILIKRFGGTINKVPSRYPRAGLENQKAMGFQTTSGKILALDVYSGNIEHVRLWIEAPCPPAIAGISILPTKKCDDLKRKVMRPLYGDKVIYLEAETKKALLDLLDWYA